MPKWVTDFCREDDGQDLIEYGLIAALVAVVIITAYGSIDTAIESIRNGAFDYVAKPCPLDELEVRIQRALERQALRQRSHDAGLIPLAITAYTSFVSPEADELRANVDDLLRHIDLAAEVGARYVRAFLGELIPGTNWASAYANITHCLEGAVELLQRLLVRLPQADECLVRAARVWVGCQQLGPEGRLDSLEREGGRDVHFEVMDRAGTIRLD